MKDQFIKQTAKDYDMEYEDVKNIKDKFPNELYERLEEFIKDRAERN